MKVTSRTYVPGLKWRMGEYQALHRLSDEAKRRVVPLLTIPPIEYDFEERKPKKTVQQHVAPFPKRFKLKWHPYPAWVDVDSSLQKTTMDSGLNVFAHVFTELRGFSAPVVPVASLDNDSEIVSTISDIIRFDRRGVALRARLAHIMRSTFSSEAKALLATLGATTSSTDLIVDLGTPGYEPYDVFALALISALERISTLSEFRSFVLIGTAIPDSLKEIDVPGGDVERHDWLFYTKLLELMPRKMRRPAYGDYTIVHPEFVALDMRKIKPAGKVVYTAPKFWAIRKGGSFRDNRGQMHGHCDYLTKAAYFRGETYSDGDETIMRCARHEIGPSSLTKWKEVGISHHIMHALEDLATLGGTP